jgi:hypothetical protein
MSGSGPTPSKISRRQRVRQRLSSLSVASNPLTPTFASSQNVTPTAALPAASNAGLALGSSSSNPTLVQPSSPSTFATAQLLQNALHRLEDEERTTIKRHIPPTPTDIQSAVHGAIDAANDKRQACLDKRWSLTLNGKNVVLREKADKVVHWLDRFKSIGDVAVNADPVHVGLPWAGIRLLLEV